MLIPKMQLDMSLSTKAMHSLFRTIGYWTIPKFGAILMFILRLLLVTYSQLL